MASNRKVWVAGDQVLAADLNGNFMNGGDGSDGALTVSSGNTNVSLGSARVVVKQYSSISITGTGSATFTNPHASGTWIFVLCQGSMTLTSSTAPMLSAAGCGAVGGAAVTSTTAGLAGTGASLADFIGLVTAGGVPSTGMGGTDGAGGAIASFNSGGTSLADFMLRKYQFLAPGAGGASGAAQNGTTVSSGVGGQGGGVLVIECGGAWNFTTANGISVAGAAGGDGSGTGSYGAGGAGGGGGGILLAIYKTLTANSGTVNVSGGVGGKTLFSGLGTPLHGAGGGGGSVVAVGSSGTSVTVSGTTAGGTGAAGYSYVGKNQVYA